MILGARGKRRPEEGGWDPLATLPPLRGGRRRMGAAIPRAPGAEGAPGPSERVCLCVRECTCEMRRRRPRRSVRSAKI